MTTEDLILRLSADPQPGPPVWRGVVLAFVPALAVALVLLALGWGFRANLAEALAHPIVAMKLLLPVLAATAAIWGALRLARPDGQAGGTGATLTALGVTALGLVAFALAQTPPAGWGAAVRGSTLVACLLSIPTLAALPTLALLMALRRGASLAPLRTGALAGLGGGAAAAALYALHCPEDNPLFYVPWYGTGILVAGAAGALLGQRLLRW
jgi:hypothetical protein